MKRLIDIIGASATLLILSPVIFLIAMLNRAYLGRPVFFVQKRPGLGGKPFDLLKFRTMKNSLDSKGQPLPDSERLTRYGKLLRSTSLDELPGLWNVVKGEMSLVGPRPLLMEYLPLYTSEQARRHDVRPGITGWAQVNGRNALRWEEKFAADLWYVDNQSFLLDSKIIVMTIIKVLKKDGVNADGEATMSKFTGS
jgi:lipopolysaccharide/colanic/teichoic acid biosynthesis glycosyltransferase